jgi:hypothetical protein
LVVRGHRFADRPEEVVGTAIPDETELALEVSDRLIEPTVRT